jgi:two-component system, chemotaxis family, protein-glutamate methylesterase/glutaminase
MRESTTKPVPGHDIVVIGASAGGVRAVLELVSSLPAGLPAALFVAIHSRPDTASSLPELLSQRGAIPATYALHGEPLVPGHLYVAPPDNHLVVRPGRLEVVRGPKENGHRPAVDVLFRTAAASYGPRVLGIVLTGHLDCGTAGLLSIKARGGLAVAQEPADATAPSMPRSAIEHVDVDHVAPLREIPALIDRLVRVAAGPWPATLPPALARIEGEELGASAEVVCPACQGKLTVSDASGFHVFRCHVGHAFSLASLAAEQAEEVERALWAAARALEEGAALSRRLAHSASGDLQRRFVEKERAQFHDAEVVRRLLTTRGLLSEMDGASFVAAESSEPASG